VLTVEKSQFALVQLQGEVMALLLASVFEMPPTKNTLSDTFSKAYTALLKFQTAELKEKLKVIDKCHGYEVISIQSEESIYLPKER
jgi:hypothetical protein